MVQRQVTNGFESYTIQTKDGTTNATFVPARGGVGSSIVMPGKKGPHELVYNFEHFWDPEIQSMPGGWSFCFPNCGRLERQGQFGAYYYDGHIYELPMHGFAWNKPWEVVDVGDNHLLIVLRDDKDTRLVYPFHFTVELFYEISHRKLMCRQTYTNHGDRPMPFYAGFHPYLLTPEPGQGKDKVILNYTPVRRFRYNQRLTDLVGLQPLFNLPSAITNPEINEQLTELGEDKQLHLHYPDGDILNFAVEGVEDPNAFSYVQLYTDPEKPFVCVEPWMGYPNALNSVQGARWLAPGHSEHAVMLLWME